MPWGHIAAKWYGSTNVQPILMVHGWQDNAGSFDTLIPLLPSDLSYLAIDWPGHGHSSHFPNGFYYHAIDFVPLLENIRQQYKWQQLSLIAHSMGSIISFVYASIFPENVNLVCSLDTLKTQNINPKIIEQIYAWRMKKLCTLDKALIRTPPEYTYAELCQRIRIGSKESVDLNSAKYLIERGTKRTTSNPEKFHFTRDIRVKFMQPLFIEQTVGLEYIKRIKAAYLFIRGDDREFSESEENINVGVQMFREYNKRFEMLKITGTHHFHLNQPELIADTMSEFLRKYHTHSSADH